MWTLFIIIITIVLTIALVKLIDHFVSAKFKPVILAIVWILIAFLGYATFKSVYTPVLFDQEKEKRYAEVIKNLIDIRNAEMAHRQVTGQFTDNWDSLIKFIEEGEFTITQRRDSRVKDAVMSKQFGIDMFKDIVVIDTLGKVSVKDSLFKNSDRYKTMMNVPVGKPGEKFKLEAGFLEKDGVKIPVFQASVKKDVILYDQDPDLLVQEKQVLSVEGINGDALTVGSMDEVKTSGNWPKTYGNNE
jgi:hypothetical protein